MPERSRQRAARSRSRASTARRRVRMVCRAEWKLERRSRAVFSSGVSRSNRSGTRATVPRSNRQAPSRPRASVTCHSESRPSTSGSASHVSGTASRSMPRCRRTASSLAASRGPEDRAVVLRERAEVHAADQVPGESVVELQAVGRLQERPQRLARRGEPGGDAPRGPRRLTLPRSAPPRRSRRRAGRTGGRAARGGSPRPGRRGCAASRG